jgi:hypothetical protein
VLSYTCICARHITSLSMLSPSRAIPLRALCVYPATLVCPFGFLELGKPPMWAKPSPIHRVLAPNYPAFNGPAFSRSALPLTALLCLQLLCFAFNCSALPSTALLCLQLLCSVFCSAACFCSILWSSYFRLSIWALISVFFCSAVFFVVLSGL